MSEAIVERLEKLTDAKTLTLAELTKLRDDTTELCARTIESLYLDSQGMILCADTIDACAAIVRSLVSHSALSRALAQGE